MIQSGRARHRVLALGAAALMVLTLGAPSAVARDGERAPASRLAAAGGEVRAMPTPLGGPVINGTVGVVSSQGYFTEAPCPCFAWVVGEVLNRTSARRDSVQVTVTFRNENDQVVGSAEAPVYLERLAPGSKSPFLVEFEGTPNPDWTYLLSVDPGTVAAQPGGGLRVVQGTTTSGSGMVEYHGTIFNPNPFPVEFVDANVTLYDSLGDVIDVWWAYTTPDTIPANGSATYAVEFFIPSGGLASIAKVGVTSQGWRVGTETYVTSWDNYFDDIGTVIYRGDIIWLAERGITTGCDAGKFCPNDDVRRDQMASFLARALDLTGSPPDAFIDDETNIHEVTINRIAAAGITTGCDTQRYCPAGLVRRDQMASFLGRALELTGTPPNAFTDDNGNIHEVQINRIAAAGVTTGCGGTNYCPTLNVTRGQMAAFLRRAFQ